MWSSVGAVWPRNGIRTLCLLWRCLCWNEGPAGGSLGQLEKGGLGQGWGYRGKRVMETVKVQAAGGPGILGTWRDGGSRRGRGF